jgi:ribosome maturation factor RimP
MELKPEKAIILACTARHLRKLGFEIVDIKPDRYNHDKTIFIFKNSLELEQALREYCGRNRDV